MKVEFYKHSIDNTDIRNVDKVLRSTFLTTGEVVKEFEQKFSKYIGMKYTVGLTSCTAALHLALLAYDIGKGDEVITTPLTFVATANAILMTGAKPVFVDVDRDTGNIDPVLVERAITKRTKAIMPVHLYGQICNMLHLEEITNKHKLKIITDSAHCIERGTGDVACFSFYATKNLNCGEGGALCTNDKVIADRVRVLRSHGMNAEAIDRYHKKFKQYDVKMLGWKYNMSNIQAALLIDQMDRLLDMQARREYICHKYMNVFTQVRGIIPIKTRNITSRHLFTILVNNRDKVMAKLQEKGIGVSINYKPVHLLSYYKERFGYKRDDFPIAESIGDRTITLPLYPKLTDREIDYVIKSVIEAVK